MSRAAASARRKWPAFCQSHLFPFSFLQTFNFFLKKTLPTKGLGVPVEAAGQVLKLHFTVKVTASLLRTEAPPGGVGGVPQNRGDAELGDKARTEVNVTQGHDGLVHV